MKQVSKRKTIIPLLFLLETILSQSSETWEKKDKVIGTNIKQMAITNEGQTLGITTGASSGSIYFSEITMKRQIIEELESIDCYPDKDLCLIGTDEGKIKSIKPSQISSGINAIEDYNHGNKTGGLEGSESSSSSSIAKEELSILFITVIPNTDFFLSYGYMEFGFIRWNLAKTDEYSISYNNQLSPSDFIFTSVMIWDTPNLAYTISKVKFIFFLDFSKMEPSTFTEINMSGEDTMEGGNLVYYSYKPANALILNCFTKTCNIYEYTKGTLKSSLSSENSFGMNSAATLKYSNILALAFSSKVEFYIGDEDGSFSFYESFTIANTKMYADDTSSGFLMLSNSKITLIYQPATDPSKCHQFCESCNINFGYSDCQVCNSDVSASKNSQGFCYNEEFGSPPGGHINYEDLQYSGNTIKIRGSLYYFIIVLIALGALIGVVVLLLFSCWVVSFVFSESSTDRLNALKERNLRYRPPRDDLMEDNNQMLQNQNNNTSNNARNRESVGNVHSGRNNLLSEQQPINNQMQFSDRQYEQQPINNQRQFNQGQYEQQPINNQRQFNQGQFVQNNPFLPPNQQQELNDAPPIEDKYIGQGYAKGNIDYPYRPPDPGMP